MQHWKPSSIEIIFQLFVFLGPFMKKREHLFYLRCLRGRPKIKWKDTKIATRNSDSQFGIFYSQRTAFNLLSDDHIRCQMLWAHSDTQTIIVMLQFIPADCFCRENEYKHCVYQRCPCAVLLWRPTPPRHPHEIWYTLFAQGRAQWWSYCLCFPGPWLALALWTEQLENLSLTQIFVIELSV